MPEEIKIRIHGEPEGTTLIYLPGLHGDWTLVNSFRAALLRNSAQPIRFVEITYPHTDWSLDDYQKAVTYALAAHGIRQGWVLAESFSSQVAWAILSRAEQDGFRMQGLILAGGFVRHPCISAVYLARFLNRAIPLWLVKRICSLYAAYARFRHRRAPETLASISEFVANRTIEADRQAICHRYNVIAQNDLRPMARQARLPVYQLCGFFDPIVPWPFVHPWLQRNCPGFRDWKIIWNADHNVLGTAPQTSVEWILRWMEAGGMTNDQSPISNQVRPER